MMGMSRKEWAKVFEHNNEPIKKIKINGTHYLGAFGVFRKIHNGQVFDMDCKTETWVKNEVLSVN